MMQQDGITPLTGEKLQQLIPASILTREQLNQWEQANIQEAVRWAFAKRRKHTTLATQAFLVELHKRMFGQVWKWAGQFRTTNKNIGVDKLELHVELKKLLDDFLVWVEFESFSVDEIAVRFHHRLVWIHLFPNGNGRHARLMADLILVSLGQPKFSWGSGQDLAQAGEVRRRYIEALRAADGHDYGRLLRFVRS